MSATSQSTELLRGLPAVEKLLCALGDVEGLPRVMVASRVKARVGHWRESALGGQAAPDFSCAVVQLRRELTLLAQSMIKPVINATGVMIHTNLGRAPLSAGAARMVALTASGYSSLEFDRESGERAKRGAFVEECLALLAGAESAAVTNNCAAALVLILRALACGDRREVLISRGQLVEIGGGFRVPEIMETSGAVLREVGATNKTNLDDYRRAIGPHTGMLLRVHRSNFTMEGFVGEPGTAELAGLARERNIPLVEDLGSGAVIDTSAMGTLEHEPTPQEILAAGADLVCFSGDKLFGGPQAGIICGSAGLIGRVKADPLFRAMRCDKMVLTALQETAVEYLHNAGDMGGTALPLLEMMATPLETLAKRAAAVCAALTGVGAEVFIGKGQSRTGGGTMPNGQLASVTLDIRPHSLSVGELALRMRTNRFPVAGYVEANVLRLDLRTVFPSQDSDLISSLLAALSPS